MREKVIVDTSVLAFLSSAEILDIAVEAKTEGTRYRLTRGRTFRGRLLGKESGNVLIEYLRDQED